MAARNVPDTDRRRLLAALAGAPVGAAFLAAGCSSGSNDPVSAAGGASTTRSNPTATRPVAPTFWT
ncbi:MAG: hypothetical protein WAR60_11855, partial [Candidatus Microthrix parvicella]